MYCAYSPWSNGVCERLNAILGLSVNKIKAESECDVCTALAWAVSTRNSLHNFGGFPPNQLVFGYNPSLPNIASDGPPALELSSNSELVARNLNAMHHARREFICNESNERIRRALLHQVRADNIEHLTQGDCVYYRRDNKWHGPATVAGRDGKQELVRHGGMLYRAHTCRLQNATPDSSAIYADQSKNLNENIGQPKDLSGVSHPSAFDLESLDTEESDCVNNFDAQPDNSHLDAEEFLDCEVDVGEDRVLDEVQHNKYIASNSAMCKPTIGQRIEYIHKDGNCQEGRIMSRAGKSTGQYKFSYNIEKNDGSIECVDLLMDVSRWRRIGDNEEVLIARATDEVFQAKMRELQVWKDNDVYEEVSDRGQNTVFVRWVITEKVKSGTPISKARLVARGFEENWNEEARRDSPTCTKDSFRLCLSIIATYKWVCNSLDIKSAFLQGKTIEREVYLRPPKEFNYGKL